METSKFDSIEDHFCVTFGFIKLPLFGFNRKIIGFRFETWVNEGEGFKFNNEQVRFFL